MPRNFPTKRDWREPSRYDDILAGLDDLRHYLKNLGSISIALPALGCGHGGLDWSQVSQMITDKLSDLDARIFVFEPADSRNAGRTEQEQPSNEHLSELEDLGFKSINLPHLFTGEGLPPNVLFKGDDSLLNQHWVALLPSKDPTEKELAAMDAVARQMAMEVNPMGVALVYATRATEKIVEVYLSHGISVVLILPFGPLTRKPVARTTTDNRPASLALLSVSAPNEAWGRTVLAQSMALVSTGASSVLLTDPVPEWLNSKSMISWTKRPMFYLRYENQSDDLRRMLDQGGARPIGRRSDSGEPNLSPLFYSFSSNPLVNVETTVKAKEHINISWGAATALQLRDLANELEKAPCADVKVQLTVSCGPGTEELQVAIRGILSSELETN